MMTISNRTRFYVLVGVATVLHVSMVTGGALPVPYGEKDATSIKGRGNKDGEPGVFVSFTRFPGQLGLLGQTIAEKLFSPFWGPFNSGDKNSRLVPRRQKSANPWNAKSQKDGIGASDFGARVKVKFSGSVQDEDGHHGDFRIVQDFMADPEPPSLQTGIKLDIKDQVKDEESDVPGENDAREAFSDGEDVWIDTSFSDSKSSIGHGQPRTTQGAGTFSLPRMPTGLVHTERVDLAEEGEISSHSVGMNGGQVEAKNKAFQEDEEISQGDSQRSASSAEPDGKDIVPVQENSKVVTLLVAKNEQDPQTTHEGMAVQSLLGKSLQRLRDWIKSEAAPAKNNISGKDALRMQGSAKIPDPVVRDGAHGVSKDHIQPKGQAEMAHSAVRHEALIEDILDGNNTKDAGLDRQDAAMKEIKVDVSPKQATNKLEDTESPKILQNENRINLFIDHNVKILKDGKSTDTLNQAPTPRTDNKVESTVPTKIKASRKDRKDLLADGRESTDDGHTQSDGVNRNRGTMPDGGASSINAKEPPKRKFQRPKRHVAKEPVGWPLYRTVDKTQRRSARADGEIRVHGSQETSPGITRAPGSSESGKASSTAGYDIQDEKSIFELGYKKFLERMALQNSNEATNKGFETDVHGPNKENTTSGSRSSNGKENGKTISDDSAAKEKGEVQGEKKETEVVEVIFEQPAQGKTDQGSVAYEIRRDDEGEEEEVGDYDEYVENLEFRRRRSGAGGRSRSLHGPKHHRRRPRFGSSRQSKESDVNALSKSPHGEGQDGRIGSKGHLGGGENHPKQQKSSTSDGGLSGILKKRSRVARSTGQGGNSSGNSKGASNHTLLDDADILFIVKHKQPSKAAPRKSKSYDGSGHNNNIINNNNNNNNKANSSVSSARKDIKDQIVFIKSLYNLKSGRGKSTAGKISRHVPNVGPHPMVKDEDETKSKSTSQPRVDGPYIRRVTQPPPFPIPPMHPLHPHLHGHLQRPPKAVDLAWKHHRETNRHAAAILAFLCLGLILFVVLVLAFTKATNESGEPRRNDSSTALYVNYPHY